MRNDRRMATYRIAEAASLLGVSDDTMRRWVDAGRIAGEQQDGRTVVRGTDLVRLATELAEEPDPRRIRSTSARNSLTGLVVKVTKDTVMAQVELVCGPHRIVSLMSAEAATDLGLEPGVTAVASIKSTNVVVERP
jgi:molybdopterin-binding protein